MRPRSTLLAVSAVVALVVGMGPGPAVAAGFRDTDRGAGGFGLSGFLTGVIASVARPTWSLLAGGDLGGVADLFGLDGQRPQRERRDPPHVLVRHEKSPDEGKRAAGDTYYAPGTPRRMTPVTSTWWR
ncbi:MAG: hypothetical protein ACRDN9_07850 [Streptosporangiaceae bacterium]